MHARRVLFQLWGSVRYLVRKGMPVVKIPDETARVHPNAVAEPQQDAMRNDTI